MGEDHSAEFPFALFGDEYIMGCDSEVYGFDIVVEEGEGLYDFGEVYFELEFGAVYL